MEISTLTNLLNQVSTIQKQYVKVAELSGGNFNIFNILGLTNSELSHSAFIAELLNPNGSHGQKDGFLKIFTEQLEIVDFDTNDAKLVVEYHISNKTEDKGGRIDILLKDKVGRHIIIENKIYASDQENQLIRYHNFDIKAPIIYLTLFGNDADDYTRSLENQSVPDELLKCISYKEDILRWLENCRKEAVTHPILRETITQYINLLKYLTHQTINIDMKNEIIKEIVKRPETIKAALEIVKNIESVKYEIINSIKEKIIIDKIAEELNLKVYFSEKTLGGKDTSFWFTKEGWSHCITFYFEKDLELSLFGIDNLGSDDYINKEFKNNVVKCLDGVGFNKDLNYSLWVWTNRFSPWSETSWEEAVIKIPIKIKEILSKLLLNLDSVEM